MAVHLCFDPVCEECRMSLTPISAERSAVGAANHVDERLSERHGERRELDQLAFLQLAMGADQLLTPTRALASAGWRRQR